MSCVGLLLVAVLDVDYRVRLLLTSSSHGHFHLLFLNDVASKMNAGPAPRAGRPNYFPCSGNRRPDSLVS